MTLNYYIYIYIVHVANTTKILQEFCFFQASITSAKKKQLELYLINTQTCLKMIYLGDSVYWR